jgi:type I restriction enzyme S subunit
VKTVRLGEIAESLPCAYGDDPVDGLPSFDVVKVSNIDGEGQFHRMFEKRRFEEHQISKLLVNEGELLVVKSSGSKANILSGKTAICGPRQAQKIVASNFLLRLRADESRVFPRFLWYVLNSAGSKMFVKTIVGASTYPNLKWSLYSSHPIPLPPLAEQRRSADILDKAHSLRVKRRTAFAQLDAFTQSIFLDMFGDPGVNPRRWPRKTMAELFDAPPIFGTMIPPVEEKRDWLSLRVGNIQDWTLDLDDRKYVNLPPTSVERHSVKDGDLLLARAIASQDHLGKCVIAHPNGERWAFDSHLMRLRFDLSRIAPEFIRHLLMTPGGRSLFLRASRKSTVQFNINTKEISALAIPVPPVDLQRQFASTVAATDQLKVTHRGSLSELDVLFGALQRRAFHGEL